MFKRKVSKGGSLIMRGSSRSADITKPDGSSLVVHQSNVGSELDNLPDEITSVLSQYEDEIIKRTSVSMMSSFSQRQQSTPKNKSNSNNVVNERSRGAIKLESRSSYFSDAVSKCGAVLLPDNDSYVLSEDQAVFSIKLNKLLLEEKSTEKFLKSLEEEISDMDAFKKMLVHTQTSESFEMARGPVQDPLIRLLLNVDCLQTDLLDILLGKLASIIMDSDSQNGNSVIIASMIKQLRFLNRVKDSQVVQKLFEIIEMAPINIQREIIFSIPEIISKEEHEVATKQLLELLKLNSALTHVVVDALTNLSISKKLRSQVKDKMLSRLDKCPTEYLPLLVQFIVTRCDNDELPQVIESLRKDLPFTLHHYEMKKEENKYQKKGKVSDEGSYVKLTFENLKFSLKASKQMTDAWMKIITGIPSATEFRPIDLIMLIIMHGSIAGRKNQVLSLFRSKIKSMVVTEIHVHQTFKILPLILTEYSSSVLEIASVFLKSFESVVSDFAGVLYETSFVRFSSYLRLNVMTEILLHIGTGTSSCITASLSILSRLAEGHKSILREYTISIMSLLMKLPVLTPVQVRNLVDIIATLIFSNPGDNSGLQDELQMFIRKQISSSKIDQHKKGVSAAIMYAKQAAADDEERGDVNLNEINSLLEMAFGSSLSCDSGRGFFNDELATLFREVKLRNDFIETWQDRTYKYAMDNLFVRNIDLECEYFPMSLQYALETDDARKYVFPAVALVKKAFEDKTPHSLLNVAPSFIRLLWCSTADIDKILPLLSASVIMPDESIYDKFDTLTVTQQKLVMDCLFSCSNYFVECINALCTQKTGERVLIRMKQLMEVRKVIAKNINNIPEYTPPVCQYYAPVQKINIRKRTNDGAKPKRGKKRKLDEEANKSPSQTVADGGADGPSTSATASVTTPKVEDGNLNAYRGYFREIHCHTYKLLRMDLKLNPTKVFKKTKLSDAMINEEAWYYKPTEKPELDSADLLFLLEDFIYKADTILKEKKYLIVLHPGKSTNSAVESVPTEIFVTGSIKILPKICAKIELLSSYCKDLIDANDKVYDAPGMFPKDAADIKLSQGAALKVIADLISWHGFRTSNYKCYLKEALIAIAKRGNPASTQENSISALAAAAGNYLGSFGEHVLLISGGLSMVKAVRACIDHCQVSTATQKCSLAKLCYDMLLRPWFTVAGAPERGATFNQHVNSLLQMYFSLVENKLQVVKSVTQIVFDEYENITGKDYTLETFKTINKGNFPLMFRSLCEALLSGASDRLSQVRDDYEISLNTWSDVIQTLLMLIEIVKINSSRINLSALLKRSQGLIQLYLNKGMPVMESALRVKSTEVLKLMKSLQAVTRFLHSICCHSKLTSDATVSAHVPAIRSLCERLTLEVKGMLILNKIPLDCFVIATLKNRDLQGNDILSQEPDEDEEMSEESELPPEEPSDSEEGDGDVSTQESNSEVY